MKFKIDQKVFYTTEKVPAVVKGFDKGKVFITYFPKGQTKRLNKLVEPRTLALKMTSNKNKYYYEVRKFHQLFNHPVTEKPQAMSPEMALKRMSWMLEELIEFLHGSSDTKDQFSELYNQFKANGEKTFMKLFDKNPPKDKLLAQVDAAGDILYFNQGDFNILGTKPDGVFNAIQAANMRKLHNGKPKFRKEDGKIIKPEDWYGPEEDIKKEIERQMKQV